MVKRPKTPPFHGGNTGSNPVRVTKKPFHQMMKRFFSFKNLISCKQKPMPIFSDRFYLYEIGISYCTGGSACYDDMLSLFKVKHLFGLLLSRIKENIC